MTDARTPPQCPHGKPSTQHCGQCELVGNCARCDAELANPAPSDLATENPPGGNLPRWLQTVADQVFGEVFPEVPERGLAGMLRDEVNGSRPVRRRGFSDCGDCGRRWRLHPSPRW